jgi:hypothetical protein
VFKLSRHLALTLGVAIPALETIRRWHQLGDARYWPTWLEDLILGAVLIAAWKLTANGRYGNAKYLAAAWGITVGMAYASFGSQLMHLDMPDPAPISSAWVAAIKGIGFVLAIAGLIGALLSPHVNVTRQEELAPPPGEGLRKHPERLDQMLDPTDDA